MGCKFSFKRVFLVASLCLAGLFGATAVVADGIFEQKSVVEKANADAPVRGDYLYVRIDDSIGGKINGHGIEDCYVCFYKSSTGSVIGANYPGYPVEVVVRGKYKYGRVKVPDGASIDHDFVINDGTGDGGGEHRTANKDLKGKYDTYVVDYQGRGTIASVGDYCSGYYTSQVYIDINESVWVQGNNPATYEDVSVSFDNWENSYPLDTICDNFTDLPGDKLGLIESWAIADGDIGSATMPPLYIKVFDDDLPEHVTTAKYSEFFSTYVYRVSSSLDEGHPYLIDYSINSYPVTFRNYNGSVIKVIDTPYGETASYSGETPTKPSEGDTFYNFSGWDRNLSTVTGSTSYTAQFTTAGTNSMRLYINFGWDGEPSGPFVGTSFGNGNQTTPPTSIAGNKTNHIPASGNDVVDSYTHVADYTLSSSGQNDLYFTWYRYEGRNNWDRWCPYKEGNAYGQVHDKDGSSNCLYQDGKLNFKNGYIYSLTDITWHDLNENNQRWHYNWYDSWGSDPYGGDGANTRYVRFYTYSLNTVGVYVHYDLNGGTHDLLSTTPDYEHKINTDLTLPSAPTKPGYTFMGWEASANGLVNEAGGKYKNLDVPISFKAIWHSNTIKVVDSNKVRLVVGYECNGDAGSLLYNGLGNYTKAWIHEYNNNVPGGFEDVIDATGTYYNENENIWSGALEGCPRRYDYFDIPFTYFTSYYYITIQRFVNGTYSANSGEIQLSYNKNDSSTFDTWSNKILFVQSSWSNTPQLKNLYTGKGSDMLATIGLSGIHTCSNDNKLNGYTGYSNWLSTYVTGKGSSGDLDLSGLNSYTITDYRGGDTSYSKIVDNSVNAYSKCLMIQTMNSNGGRNQLGLNIFGNNLLEEESHLTTIIIIIASSVSLLSITALSILLVKKRKSKEQ